jgi:hypothetical protein
LISENATLPDSAISTSDDATDWSRCLRACLVTLAICAFLLFAFVIAIDPYDSGKFGLFGINGVADRNTLTANASRARDAGFDSAIIGNSTSLLINPTTLSRATGLHFVQLSVVGGSPREELTVLDYFLRQHTHVGALVVGADPSWCVHEQNNKPRPFPYWLYGRSRLVYAGALFSGAAIEHAVQRVQIGLGQRRRSDPTGTFDSEDTWPIGMFLETNRPADPPPAANTALRDVFPWVSQLDKMIKALPNDTGVVVLVPPTQASTVAQPGTPEAADREACNAALQRTVAGRPHSNFINYRVDNALTRDRGNFIDYIHYRSKMAAKVAAGIGASLRDGEAAKIDF